MFKKRQFLSFLLIASLLILGLFGYWVFNNKGIEDREFNLKYTANTFGVFYGNEKNHYGRQVKNFMYDCDFYNFSNFSKSAAGINKITGIPKYCYSRGSISVSSVFLWGDSHAQMLYYGLVKNLPADKAFYQVSRAGCKPSITNSHDSICNMTNAFAIEEFAYLKPAVVIVAQRDSWDQVVVKEIASKLSTLGVSKILFVGKSPEWKSSLPKVILRKYWLNAPKRLTADLDVSNYAADRAAKVFVSNTPNSQFVDLWEYFCNDMGCLVHLGNSLEEGLTSFDSNHLSPIASDEVAKNLLLPLIYDSIKK